MSRGRWWGRREGSEPDHLATSLYCASLPATDHLHFQDTGGGGGVPGED